MQLFLLFLGGRSSDRSTTFHFSQFATQGWLHEIYIHNKRTNYFPDVRNRLATNIISQTITVPNKPLVKQKKNIKVHILAGR